ncbi:MAG: peptide chain release factor 2 [Clostridia bacterium]|nr:peptide chain release factor 2 [Clostridia bacterium]
MLSEMGKELEALQVRLNELRDSLDLTDQEKQAAALEKQMMEEGFWDDLAKSQQVSQRLSSLKEKIENFASLSSALEDLQVFWELALEEADPNSLEKELQKELNNFRQKLENQELQLLLSGEYDQSGAIMTLHAGAGGTESQDWVEMLLRMYTRWAEDNQYQVRLVDSLPGDEAGIKSATIFVEGINAYGYLRSEAGVHRLVRISPFDAAGRRHTSFASVDVLPEVDDSVEIAINPEELKIDTYRASGAGGQHVNKTDSAVRITHLPTGIVVQCQSERSQIMNRASAMSMLKARLVDLEIKKKEAELNAIRGEQMEIAWGSLIRSYVFHPYSLVKDHRTNLEMGNVQAVMDGDLTPFINAYLRKMIKI